MRKKFLSLLLTGLMSLGVFNIPVYAYGTKSITVPDVSYSVCNALSSHDDTIFQSNEEDTEVCLGTLSVNDVFSNQISADQVFNGILNSKLTAYGVDKTVAQWIAPLIQDGNPLNKENWCELSEDWSYCNYNTDKKKTLSYQSKLWNDCFFIIRFNYYKSTREITFNEILVSRPNGDYHKLTLGQISKFVKEVAPMSSDKRGWQLENGKWYYYNEFGVKVRNTTIDGYDLDENGVWIA